MAETGWASPRGCSRKLAQEIGPKRSALALAELEALARARLTRLLALDDARVTGQEAGLLQRRPELGVHRAERARQAVADRAGLAREAAAAHVHGHVDLALLLEHVQRLVDDHLRRRTAEVLVHGAAVDHHR